MRKYELIEPDTNFLIPADKPLFRIRSLIDIPQHHVKAGDLGGYVESENNLSHEGDCWIRNNAIVYENAHVMDNALIDNYVHMWGESVAKDCAVICQSAIIWSKAIICGHAVVSGNAIISDDVIIQDYANVTGNALICDQAKITDCIRVYDQAVIEGRSLLMGEAHICGHTHLENTVLFSNCNGELIIFPTKNMTFEQCEKQIENRIQNILCESMNY